MRDEPVIRDFLSSTQGDKNLRALDRIDSAQNGTMLFEALKLFVPESRGGDFRAMCFLNVHLTGALALLCSTLDEDTAATMQAQFIASTKRDLMALKTGH